MYGCIIVDMACRKVRILSSNVITRGDGDSRTGAMEPFIVLLLTSSIVDRNDFKDWDNSSVRAISWINIIHYNYYQ